MNLLDLQQDPAQFRRSLQIDCDGSARRFSEVVDPWLLNTQNGTLDLRKGTLRPYDPNDLITKLAPVEYDPVAKGGTWERYIRRFLPNPNVRCQVQRDLGRALPGVILEESLSIWYGAGTNGKTTTSRVLRKILGDYAGRAAPNLPVQSK